MVRLNQLEPRSSVVNSNEMRLWELPRVFVPCVYLQNIIVIIVSVDCSGLFLFCIPCYASNVYLTLLTLLAC